MLFTAKSSDRVCLDFFVDSEPWKRKRLQEVILSLKPPPCAAGLCFSWAAPEASKDGSNAEERIPKRDNKCAFTVKDQSVWKCNVVPVCDRNSVWAIWRMWRCKRQIILLPIDDAPLVFNKFSFILSRGVSVLWEPRPSWQRLPNPVQKTVPPWRVSHFCLLPWLWAHWRGGHQMHSGKSVVLEWATSSLQRWELFTRLLKLLLTSGMLPEMLKFVRDLVSPWDIWCKGEHRSKTKGR